MADSTQQTDTQQAEDVDLMSQEMADDEREDLQRLMADGDGDEEEAGSEESEG